MCGNVSNTDASWQLCVPGFFQFALKTSSGVDLAHSPLSLKHMMAAGRAGTTFTVPQPVRGLKYQLFFRENPSMLQGRSWTFWQRLVANSSTDNSSRPDVDVPPCGPICGDVPFSQAERNRTSDFQPFCQAGMLRGEMAPYNVQIGPGTATPFPYHLQKVLKMAPGTFGPVSYVLLSGQKGDGRMLFRQGLHADGWTAIFQQRFIPA